MLIKLCKFSSSTLELSRNAAASNKFKASETPAMGTEMHRITLKQANDERRQLFFERLASCKNKNTQPKTPPVRGGAQDAVNFIDDISDCPSQAAPAV